VLIPQYRAGKNWENDLSSRIWLLEQLVDTLNEQMIELNHRINKSQ
jgi:hypothetical protein